MSTATKVKRRTPTPVYSQIYDVLRARIGTELGYDEPLPSEREIAETFKVARMTARKTIDQLVREGLVYRVPGRGAYVARPRLVLPLALRSFTDDIRDRGMRPGSRVLSTETVPADARVADRLGVPAGSAVHRLRRLRLADDEPIAIETTHLAATRADDLFSHDLSQSLYQTLESAYGLVIDGGTQTISAVLLTADDAEMLGVSRGSPALCFERTTTAAGQPLEYTTSIYRADRYQLTVRFGQAVD
ncbi:MAG: GntR family transcriptional regulator [Actinomycetes bacterium]